MGKENLLSDQDVKEIAKEYAEQIVDEARSVMGVAINTFYADYSPHMYKRTFGFSNFANFWFEDVAKPIKDGYRLTFKFSADDVTVGTISFPHSINGDISEVGTGNIRNGDPEWAFDSGFVHGYHGGPNFPPYHTMGGIWTLFEDYINGL